MANRCLALALALVLLLAPPAGATWSIVLVDSSTGGDTATIVTGWVTGRADVGGIEVAEAAVPGAVGWSALADMQPDAPTVDKTMIEAATRGCTGQRWSGDSAIANLPADFPPKCSLRGSVQVPTATISAGMRFLAVPALALLMLSSCARHEPSRTPTSALPHAGAARTTPPSVRSPRPG